MKIAVATFIVLLFCAFSYLLVDKNLALYLHNNPPALYAIFAKITYIGLARIWFALCVVGYFIKPVRQIAIALFLTLLSSGAIVHIIKFLSGRPRPKFLFEQNIYGFTGMDLTFKLSSFPSGHSQVIFAVMTILALARPSCSIFFYATAFMVAASRIVLGSHYLSDIVFGGYIGVMAAYYWWNRLAK